METQTAGAFGAPERIDLAPYKHALTQAPDLVQHLAHLVTPGRMVDGQPTARDLQSTPARLAPLDQIDATFTWLWNEAAYWTPPGALNLEWMVRRNGDLDVIGPRGVYGSPDGGDTLHAMTLTLTNRILAQWGTIEHQLGPSHLWGQMEAREWIEHADRHLLLPLAQWPLTQRTPVPARPRECPTCGERDVWADLDTTTGVCASCRAVVRPDVWVPIKTAAQVLGVDASTIRRWILAGDLTTNGDKPRRVELGAVREAKQVIDGRAKLGIVE